MVGFEDTVRLGEFGEVVENPEKVMGVYLLKAPAKRTAAGNHEQLEPYPQVAQLYLRGTMVTRYSLTSGGASCRGWTPPMRRSTRGRWPPPWCSALRSNRWIATSCSASGRSNLAVGSVSSTNRRANG